MRGCFTEIYEELSTGSKGFASSDLRAEAQVMRLVLVYALMDSASKFSGLTFEAAYALWQYCEASAQYIFRRASGTD